jgi:hypothetical protein
VVQHEAMPLRDGLSSKQPPARLAETGVVEPVRDQCHCLVAAERVAGDLDTGSRHPNQMLTARQARVSLALRHKA